MAVMADEKKKKIGWALNRPFLDRVNELAASYQSPGLKATLVEAALLQFFESDRERQTEYVSRVQQAELRGEIQQLVSGARPRQARVAAKKSGKTSGVKRRGPKT